jgi:hypothetical protein
MVKLIYIKKSTRKGKKMMARFEISKNKFKTVHFGASGYSDYTKHKDKDRRERYIARHRKRENWNDPLTAGTLSRYVLWSEPTLKGGIKRYRDKFNL